MNLNCRKKIFLKKKVSKWALLIWPGVVENWIKHNAILHAVLVVATVAVQNRRRWNASSRETKKEQNSK
jgi:hypothetical protein